MKFKLSILLLLFYYSLSSAQNCSQEGIRWSKDPCTSTQTISGDSPGKNDNFPTIHDLNDSEKQYDDILVVNDFNSIEVKEQYSKFLGEFIESINDKRLIVLRRLNNNQYLILDPSSLKTQIKRLVPNEIKKRTWGELEKKFQSTPYIKLRKEAKKKNTRKFYANRGIRNAGNRNNIILTTDLCPTKKNLNYPLYDAIARDMKKGSRGVPVGVAISGKWIENHPKDLQWLKKKLQNDELSITWINHSYNHTYIRDRILKNNFMLAKGTNLKKEILNTEKLMLDNNLEISVFFRFPGLVSNKKLYDAVLDYGLIPLGSDSWIAKNQYPKNGSIVLVHGNGNEKIGVTKLRSWMKSPKNTFKPTSLSEAFINKFK